MTERAALPTTDTAYAGEVQSLDDGFTGRWLITTQGSRHLLDLDQGTYLRMPGAASGAFAHDEATVTLTRIERWPAVGDTFLLWFDDPERPHAMEHWRRSSRIRAIRRVTADEDLDR